MKVLKFIFYPFLLIKETFNLFVIYLPGNTGIKLRYILYKNRFKKCGKRVFIDTGVFITGFKNISLGSDIHIDKNTIINTGTKTVGIQHHKTKDYYNNQLGEISIGNHVHIVNNCTIAGYGGVKIGDKCTVSAGSKLYSQSNLPNDPAHKEKVVSIMPYETAHFILSPIVLENNVWLGLHTIVMPGTFIGTNSFAVSNSLLVGDYPENSHIAGQPAKVKRKRFE